MDMKNVHLLKHNMGATKHTIINATVKRNWRDHVNISIYFQLVLKAADFPYNFITSICSHIHNIHIHTYTQL